MAKPESQGNAVNLIDQIVDDMGKLPPVDLSKVIDIKITLEAVEKDAPAGLNITKTYHDQNANYGALVAIQLGLLHGEEQLARIAMARLPRVPG